MRITLFLLLLFVSQLGLQAQSIQHFDPDHTFTHQDQRLEYPIRTFASVDEAESIIRSIMNVVGLKPNFEIRAADISNAAAVVYNGERYILYDRAFIQAINNASSTDWAGISILAHEIGHHLNGHTLNRGGSNHADELEADEFSGFVLKKLGANLEEAQAAMYTVSEDYDTATHPERSRRLSAIAQGWKNAGEQHLALKKAVESEAEEATYARKQQNTGRQVSSERIVSEVVFENTPKAKLFITTSYRLVGLKNDQLLLLGKMEKTNSREFPYVLTDHKSSLIYISHTGYLFNKEGQRIGFLKEYKG